MENNSSNKNKNLKIIEKSQSSDKKQFQKVSKNEVIYRNIGDNKTKINDEETMDDDHVDHPQPLSSDSEGREDIRKSQIIQEIKNNNRDNELIKENNKIQNNNCDYFDDINYINNVLLNQNNNKIEKKIVMVNKKEINKIRIKNKLKNKLKQLENYYNSADNKHKQNPFKNSDIKIKYFNKDKIYPKQIIKKQILLEINKADINENIINQNNISKNKYIIHSNRQNQNKTKDFLLMIKHKPKLTLNERGFSNNIVLDSFRKNINIQVNKPIVRLNSDINFKNLNHINIQPSPNKKSILNLKKKINLNVTSLTTDADSSKEKNNKQKKSLLRLNNNNKNMTKHSITNGGKYNNLQTTYVISSKKLNSNDRIKVNKNIFFNNNEKNKLRNIILNQTNISYKNNLKVTQNKINESINSSFKRKINLYEKNPKKNIINSYQLIRENKMNTINTSNIKNSHHIYMNDSSYIKESNNKYYNLKKSFYKANLKHSKEFY